MPRRPIALLLVLAFVAALVVAPATTLAKDSVVRQAAKGQLRPAHITTPSGSRTLPFFSSGIVQAAQEDIRAEEGNAASASDASSTNLGVQAGSLGCRDRTPGGNVRVNQDCTYRRQAEELIKFNPSNPQNLIAGQNDSRIGFNKCGFDYSFDSGHTWGDGIPPFFQRLNDPASEEPVAGDPNRHTIVGGPGTAHTFDAASDPALAFDSQGRAYYSCVAFDVNDNASSVIVTMSPQGAGGSFYNNVAAAGRRYIVADDNSPLVFHDKEFITADAFANSPNRDNVYITWTVFRMSTTCGPQPNPQGLEQQCASPIFGSMSTDHGFTWSTPEEISGASTSLCFFGNQLDPTRPANACDFDQGSDPIVRPNGDLAVVFNNGNTPAGDINSQQLSVLCHPSGSSPAGSARLNCAAPVKVGDDITTGEPLCDFGRGPEECIPGAFIRTDDYPRIAINRANGDLFATWQDYRTNEYDIHLSTSTDGGLHWTEAKTAVNPDKGKDHYFAAIDVVPSNQDNNQNQQGQNGNSGVDKGDKGAADHVAVSYFRTVRVPNENPAQPCAASFTGGGCFAAGQPGVQQENSDYFLSGGRNLATPYADTRVSPNFPPPDGNQAGFNGDYSGLIVVGERAHPIWSDTRNAAPAGQGVMHDEDVFTDSLAIPDGQDQQRQG